MTLCNLMIMSAIEKSRINYKISRKIFDVWYTWAAHVYAEPNPECDAKISSLMSELYSLESSARSDVSSAIQSAKVR